MTTALDADARLGAALDALVRQRPLLLGLDFDGTLAPLVERPADARALPGSLDAVTRLAAVPDVTVALVSGRARDDLIALTGLPDGGAVQLVGSHGAELGPHGPALDDAARERLSQVRQALTAVAERHPGAHVETKPSAAVLHTRQLGPQQSAAATAEALAWLSGQQGLHVTRGKEVVEVAVVPATKGAALGVLRERLSAAALLYVGDDVTDETVFATLGRSDVGVKVGAGETVAAHRLADPDAVRQLLRTLTSRLA